ncbi:MAG: MFS transporter [Candidatus Daviesbacteria bacterium]|nr:MFS transporter [Candidatus Daviesbacteria bacterium]
MTPKISPFLILKIPVFRNFLIGTFVSEIGSQMQVVAIAWQVYELTRNPASLGFIGLANFLPILLFSLFAGLAADKLDRKKLLIVSQGSLAILAFVLFLITNAHIATPWMIYSVLVFYSIASAFSLPARQAVLPNLAPKHLFMNAVSLHTLQFQASVLIGPAIAGLLIAGLGVGPVYLFNAISFLVFIVGILMIRVPLSAKDMEVEFSTHSIMEGIKFVISTPILYSTMILDFLATFFGTATILMPIFATDILHVGPKGLGLLYSAPAVGAVLAGLLLSFFHHHQLKNQGKIIVISIIFYGAATIGFGLSRNLTVSLLFLGLAGFGDMISSVIRNTIRQLVTPDHLRGRMVSIMRIFFQGGPQLGEVEAGLLAAAVGGPISVVVGGVGVIVITSLLAYFNPKLREYQGKEVAV